MFNAINHILFEEPSLEIDAEIFSEFSPYMTNRYFSFYNNGDFADYVNETTNRYSNIFDKDEDRYRFFEHIIPKVKRKKINYVKKPKHENVNTMPIPDFYSKREWLALQKSNC